MHINILIGGMLALATTAPGAQRSTAANTPARPAQATAYKKELPAALAKKAKIAEPAAAATALARVPNGKIKAVELEQEGGKLVYSYDLAVAGKSGIDEIQVDAVSGLVVSTEHETPAAMKAEAAQDAMDAKAANAAKAAAAKVKKPPMRNR